MFAERGFHGTNVPEVAAKAGVGVGTLYRYFASKEALVNQVYRDAKQRLRAALLDGAAPVDLNRLDAARIWFLDLWQRLGHFARTEPEAFRFLEMQDHLPYLDAESRQLELSVLAPLWMAGRKLRDRTAGAPVDVMIALLWGAFVGLVKAERLGYLRVDDEQLALAGEQCWRLVAPDDQGLRPARAKPLHPTEPTMPTASTKPLHPSEPTKPLQSKKSSRSRSRAIAPPRPSKG